MNLRSSFLYSLCFYCATILVAVYFAVVYDYDPSEHNTYTLLGVMVGSSSTLLAISLVLFVEQIIKEKKMVKNK